MFIPHAAPHTSLQRDHRETGDDTQTILGKDMGRTCVCVCVCLHVVGVLAWSTGPLWRRRGEGPWVSGNKTTGLFSKETNEKIQNLRRKMVERSWVVTATYSTNMLRPWLGFIQPQLAQAAGQTNASQAGSSPQVSETPSGVN